MDAFQSRDRSAHLGMPLLKISTNLDLSEETTTSLLQDGTKLVADELGKSEQYVQILVKSRVAMAFGGTLDPSALIELSGLGLPVERHKSLASALTDFVSDQADVPGERIFVQFTSFERTNWAWNGDTFA